jgi:hypothetical membrane protein
MSAENNRSLMIGALFWVASIQYYVVQIIVALAWNKDNGYSWLNHTISDLANTVCGSYGDRSVCSPLHGTMNISFIVLGVTMIFGAALIGSHIAQGRLDRLGFACMALAGGGTIVVGLFPENSISTMHILGAAVPFVLGNAGPIIIGCSRDLTIPAWLRAYSILTGLIGLLALILLLLGIYAGLGIGGIERIVAYPQSIWMIVFGFYFLKPSAFSRSNHTLER